MQLSFGLFRNRVCSSEWRMLVVLILLLRKDVDVLTGDMISDGESLSSPDCFIVDIQVSYSICRIIRGISLEGEVI